jgi:hypothetical protein
MSMSSQSISWPGSRNIIPLSLTRVAPLRL